jgi:hypothetical protein
MVKRLFVDRIVFSVPGIALSGFLTDPDPLGAEVTWRAGTTTLSPRSLNFCA